MTRVFIVAPSPAERDRLRILVETAQVRVIGDDEALGARHVPSEADVIVLAGAMPAAETWAADPEAPPPLVWLVPGDVRGAVERVRAMGLPGWAVLPADAGRDELGAAIGGAVAGLVVMPAGPAGISWSLLPRDPDGREHDVFQETLTPREHEVLESMARGLSNKEIAERLGMSEHTAKYHVASILAKLGAANRADAVGRALRNGLVSL